MKKVFFLSLFLSAFFLLPGGAALAECLDDSDCPSQCHNGYEYVYECDLSLGGGFSGTCVRTDEHQCTEACCDSYCPGGGYCDHRNNSCVCVAEDTCANIDDNSACRADPNCCLDNSGNCISIGDCLDSCVSCHSQDCCGSSSKNCEWQNWTEVCYLTSEGEQEEEEEEEEENGNGGGGGTNGGGGTTFQNPLTVDSFQELIERLINFLFWIGITVAPVMLIIAGFMFVTSAGDPNKTSNAKKMVAYTLIGLVVIILAKGLVEVIKSILGVS